MRYWHWPEHLLEILEVCDFGLKEFPGSYRAKRAKNSRLEEIKSINALYGRDTSNLLTTTAAYDALLKDAGKIEKKYQTLLISKFY